MERCITVSSFFPVEEEINNMKIELEKYGIQMPAFSKIGGILANELSVDEAACKERDIFWVQMGLLIPFLVIVTVVVVLDIRNSREVKSIVVIVNTVTVFCAIVTWK